MGAFPPDVPVKHLPGSRGDSLNLMETGSDGHSLGATWKSQHRRPSLSRSLFLGLSASSAECGANYSAAPMRPVRGWTGMM